MPELSRDPDDYADHDAYAHAQALNAKHDVADPNFDWAIGGDPDGHTETEYAIEPMPGGDARAHTDELYGAVEELPNYRNGARIVTREITYGGWRYVTPEEIEQWASQ
jgi:hypothetical protein